MRLHGLQRRMKVLMAARSRFGPLIYLPLGFFFFFTVWRGQNLYFQSVFHLIQAAYYLLLVWFLGFYLRQVYRKVHAPGSVEIFLLAVLIIPVFSALCAWTGLNQPLWYGLLAERRWLKAVAVLMLIYSVRKQLVHRDAVIRFTVIASVLSLVVYLAVLFSVDLVNLPRTNFVQVTDGKGLIFRLNSFPILFGFFYFLSQWLTGRLVWSLVPAVAFSDYLFFFNKSRSLSLAAIIAVVLVFCVLRGRQFHFRRFMLLLILVIFSYFPLKRLSPDLVYNSLGHFHRMVNSGVQYVHGAIAPEGVKQETVPPGTGKADKSVRNGSADDVDPIPGKQQPAAEFKKKSYAQLIRMQKKKKDSSDDKADSSTASRLQQAKKAIGSLNEKPVRWLIGHGAVSTRWQNGYRQIVGRFHVSDIGILGAVFLYGIAGLLLLSVQLLLGLKYCLMIVRGELDIFRLSVLAAWICCALLIVVGPYMAVFPGISLTMLGLLHLETAPYREDEA